MWLEKTPISHLPQGMLQQKTEPQRHLIWFPLVLFLNKQKPNRLKSHTSILVDQDCS